MKKNYIISKIGGRGFGGAILLFAVILAAGILLAANMQTRQEYSLKEIIPELKTQMSGFALTLQQMSDTCTWIDGGTTAGCINTNATSLITKNWGTNPINGVSCSISTVASCNGNATTPPTSCTISIKCLANAIAGTNSISIDSTKEISLFHS